MQLADPFDGGGPNGLCLVEAQKEFARIGACDAASVRHSRLVTPRDRRDPEWRPFDPLTDRCMGDSPEDRTLWLEKRPEKGFYYWRPDYWLLPENLSR